MYACSLHCYIHVHEFSGGGEPIVNCVAGDDDVNSEVYHRAINSMILELLHLRLILVGYRQVIFNLSSKQHCPGIAGFSIPPPLELCTCICIHVCIHVPGSISCSLGPINKRAWSWYSQLSSLKDELIDVSCTCTFIDWSSLRCNGSESSAK